MQVGSGHARRLAFEIVIGFVGLIVPARSHECLAAVAPKFDDHLVGLRVVELRDRRHVGVVPPMRTLRARTTCDQRSGRQVLVGQLDGLGTIQVHVHQVPAGLSEDDPDIAGTFEVSRQVCLGQTQFLPALALRPFRPRGNVDRHPPAPKISLCRFEKLAH